MGPLGVRFYAGVPLITPDGKAVGAFCVIYRRRKILSPLQTRTLHVLAKQVIAQLELRLRLHGLELYAGQLEILAERRAQQLLHAERLSLLGTMYAGVAHEIKNPMTFISGNMQFVEKVWDDVSLLLSGGNDILPPHLKNST